MLMVSGIGPRETLTNLGVEVLSDRPGVGQNMWVCRTFATKQVARHGLRNRQGRKEHG